MNKKVECLPNDKETDVLRAKGNFCNDECATVHHHRCILFLICIEVQGARDGMSLGAQTLIELKIMGVCVQAWFGQQLSLLI